MNNAEATLNAHAVLQGNTLSITVETDHVWSGIHDGSRFPQKFAREQLADNGYRVVGRFEKSGGGNSVVDVWNAKVVKES